MNAARLSAAAAALAAWLMTLPLLASGQPLPEPEPLQQTTAPATSPPAEPVLTPPADPAAPPPAEPVTLAALRERRFHQLWSALPASAEPAERVEAALADIRRQLAAGQPWRAALQAARLEADLGERTVSLEGGARLKIVQGAVR